MTIYNTTGTTAIPSYQLQSCQWCGPHVAHVGLCPRIRAIEYHPDGTLKRVEFHALSGAYNLPAISNEERE